MVLGPLPVHRDGHLAGFDDSFRGPEGGQLVDSPDIGHFFLVLAFVHRMGLEAPNQECWAFPLRLLHTLRVCHLVWVWRSCRRYR